MTGIPLPLLEEAAATREASSSKRQRGLVARVRGGAVAFARPAHHRHVERSRA